MSQTSYENPILPGFYPDPSACRIGGDYYLVTSSFEYFPGVPLFHSRDLVNWHQIGHCLSRPSQLPLREAKSSAGIFAPTLRHHRDKFYLITTNVSGGGNFFVTAHDPGGEWSEPVWLQESGRGMDPSLFFDDDGKVYYTRHGGGERGSIVQAEIDLANGKLLGEPRTIWAGTGGVWPEGPHLYKVENAYYLMISEGGTSYGHMVTIARAASPWGPFEPCPHNPILSHRGRAGLTIQATGHGDLVEAENGTWWMVLLGIRPPDGEHHHLGRETFLAPVTWDERGWPVVHGNQPITPQMPSEGLPAPHPWDAVQSRDEFAGEQLAPCYNFLRNPREADWSLTARPSFLRLRGGHASLNDVASPAFVGRRQQHLRCRVSALLDFNPECASQEAGLTVRANEENHYDLAVTQSDSQRRVRLRTRIGGAFAIVAEGELRDPNVVLTIEAHADRYEFCYAAAGGELRSLGTASTRALSSEVIRSFTGAYFGMYAGAGDSPAMPPADFDWFEYLPLES